MLRVSTKIKVACGYILLTLLLFFSIQYIYRKIQLLTQENTFEQKLIQQRRVTNQIILDLYQAEIVSHSFSIGQLNQLNQYNRLIKAAYWGIDSLRSMVTDPTQQARLDSVSFLLKKKEENTRFFLQTLQKNSTDKIYQQYIEKLEKKQDSFVHKQPVYKTMVIHSNTYTIRKKPKNFFKRIAEVFSPEKGDTIKMEHVTKEETTDTIKKITNPSDSVVKLLKNVQSNVSDNKQKSIQNVKKSTDNLRTNGIRISRQINKILISIDQNEQWLAENKANHQKEIRQNAANSIKVISIAAILLATIFLTFIWRDITRSNHYRHELEKAKRYAENLLIAREKLMLTITHDIKAPAGTILGYIELLSRMITDGRQAFYLNNMKNATQHLLDLIKSLLDFYRLESNKMDINNVSFNPSQLFNEIYLSFKPLAEAKRLEFIYKLEIDSSDIYTGDPFRIRQIAENLLSNSIKFTKEGSIELRISGNDKQFVFSVSDTGCGISKEEQKHIFEEFTRLSGAQGEEGFGLGLSIVMKIIQLMKGNIEIKSNPGSGSAFTVTLPIKHATVTKEEKRINEPCKIILIDDDPIQLQLTMSMLDHPDVKVVCCEKPEDLLGELEGNHFDLMMTDIQMPAMNGFDIIKKVRQTPSANNRIPIIAITARSDMSKEFFRSEGFANSLLKPFNSAELHQVIAETLQMKTFEKPYESQKDIQKSPFSMLTAFSDQDTNEAIKIMNTFISETEKDMESLIQAGRDNNLQAVKRFSHKMLPRFKLLEANTCTDILRAMETCKEDSETTNGLKESLNILSKEIQNIIEEAKKYRDSFC